jgi:hypothetical protein
MSAQPRRATFCLRWDPIGIIVKTRAVFHGSVRPSTPARLFEQRRLPRQPHAAFVGDPEHPVDRCGIQSVAEAFVSRHRQVRHDAAGRVADREARNLRGLTLYQIYDMLQQ